MLDSNTATNRLRMAAFNKNRNSAVKMAVHSEEAVNPQGKNILAPKARKIKNLLAAAHSISASLFPEYSRIIAS
jgi:hypothetical protein